MHKIYSFLGIARKGGNVSIGFDSTKMDIEKNKSFLVIIALDASDKTKKNIKFICDKYNCKYIEFGEKELLGKSLGRKVVSVLSITDKNISSYLINNV
ncbi:MAG: ribosomal L7Ae/L30e/S12e/Gadd45 family protein [Tissierellia bacterium]|jgi:ribosomal protein L7Ae-like RNA K-turn-binding protein|nr:ribosomal L7Ae/L30e/S12e/Gadd45 family protein [Tissierellia bacterium]MDD3226074.1 ribosomal L7Ae/L30e/S12e/Gadd45 family protein [Tissierellia bacterium]MDD3751478.1 ribosomal L7Ae/L30e/S12e/Gadd45 family protein [Tissierellia bacterium]MDD4045702.1 ribosomal L7Ae/L30e/S12e/Gadd45 family protein [Tissierellia bacterium]MDD4677649.1 ribosomal L7Ae/L30e/S12e/Gadd45 family protein [Tissierellia bacterium]